VEDIKDRLRSVIVKALRIDTPPGDIVGDDLNAELKITSIDALEILIHVEMEFGIRVADEDLNSELVSSLNALASYISARLSDPAQAPNG